MKPPEGVEASQFLRHTVPAGSGDFVDAARFVDHEKVVQVALNPDDELRNLQVALLYSLTSARMDKRLLYGTVQRANDPPLRANANWFTVAQWAVLTVGRNMRGRDLPHRTASLPDWVRRRLTPAVLNLRAADDRRVAAALSYGQVMVFASVYRALLNDSAFADSAPLPVGPRMEQAPAPGEADDPGGPPSESGPLADPPSEPGPEGDVGDLGDLGGTPQPEPFPVDGLRDMVVTYLADKQREADLADEADQAQRKVVKAMAMQLKVDPKKIDLDPRISRAEFYESVLNAIADRAGYEEELRYAFELYRRAAVSCPERREHSEDRSRADLIFEATLRIAAVEQVILDEAVTLVVDHLPRHIMEQTQGRLATFAERSLRVPRRIAEINANRRLSGFGDLAKDVWARVMTDQVMVVAFPSETVRIGRDIPMRDWRKPFYAQELEKLSPSAEAVFDQFDRSLGDGRGAGAGDWRRYDDRMNFVSNLLRSRQQDASLFWQPFTEEDVDRVRRGLYPNRVADPFEQAVRSPSFPLDEDGFDLDTVSCDEVTWNKAPYDPMNNPYGGGGQ